MKVRYYQWILLALFLIVLGSRLFFAFQTPNFDSEAYFNLRQIEHITETGLPLYYDDLSYGGRTYFFPPFFHYMLAFFNLFLPLSLVGKIIPNLLISFLVIIVYLTAEKITKRKDAALFAAFISGFIPVLFARTIYTVSELTLVVPLVFLAMYCLMNIQEKRFLYTYLIIILILSLTHASTFFLILGLILYLIISEVEIIKRNRAETELILFSTFAFLSIQALFYKKAFLMHGVSLIWKNMPLPIIAQHFSQISILGTITQIGWLPFFYGLYLMFKYIFKEKNKYIYMYISLVLPIVILLWLKWIEPPLGLIFLGATLSILFSEFYKITWEYFKKTKFSRWKWIFIVVLTTTFLITSVGPAFYLAKGQLNEVVPSYKIEALEWLGNRTEEKDIVLGALGEGHLITYSTKRKNVFDNNFLLIDNAAEILTDVEKIFSSQSRVEAIELLDKYKVDYIIVSDKVKRDYQIQTLIYRDEDCIKRIYRGEIEIYKNNCKIRTLAI